MSALVSTVMERMAWEWRLLTGLAVTTSGSRRVSTGSAPLSAPAPADISRAATSSIVLFMFQAPEIQQILNPLRKLKLWLLVDGAKAGNPNGSFDRSSIRFYD